MTGLRQQSQLPNGLTIVTETVDSVRSVALGIWIRAGSRYEPAAAAGISHFLEHTVFKGTETRNTYQIAAALEDVGGSVNAFTGKEYTCYHARFLSEYLSTGVDLLCDLLLNPVFPQAEIEREKGVVLDELRDSQDVPEEIIFEEYDHHIYPGSPLGLPVIGNPDSIRAFQPEMLRDYLQTHYGPENTIIVAAGYVDHEELVELVKDHYSNIPRGAGRPEPVSPTDQERGVIRRGKDIQQAHLVTGVRTFSVFREQRWTLAVLNAILSGGMSSRLFQNIRESKGVAYQVFSFANLFLDTGSFGVYLATDPGKLELARHAVSEELEKLVSERVDPSELERVKAQYKSGVVMSDESMERRMLRLGRQQVVHGKNIDLDTFLERIEEIDANHIQQLAQELFRPDQFMTTILYPENGTVS